MINNTGAENEVENDIENEVENEVENDVENEVENEVENITIKTNLIDSGNDDNNHNSSDLSKLCKSIEILENFHHIEIGKILKLNNVYLNENSNGIFVNLNKISYKTYQEISNYIDFVKKQENEINKDEKLKRNLQTTYFKDNKDK